MMIHKCSTKEKYAHNLCNVIELFYLFGLNNVTLCLSDIKRTVY